MSQENVKIVKRAVAAVNQRNIDGYLACCTEDVRLVTPVADVAGAYDGPNGIRRFFTGTGRASGIPIENATGNVYDLANGKIKRIRIFFDREQALEAAGLRE
jgi:ketosteroid isomerase-like protein